MLRLRLRDIGRVIDTSAERQFFSRVQGHDAVTLSIQKTSDANTVEVVDGVRKAMGGILKTLGPGYQVSYAQDQSDQVRDSQSVAVLLDPTTMPLLSTESVPVVPSGLPPLV